MSNDSSRAWLRALELTAPISSNPLVTLPTVIERLAEKFESAPALVSAEVQLNYRSLATRVDYYAQWAIRHRLNKGDVVCLLMNNCPDYFAIWLGITRIAGIVSLLNTNLRGAVLRHSIELVSPRHIIVGRGLQDAYVSVRDMVQPNIVWWGHGTDVSDLPRIDKETASRPNPSTGLLRLPAIHDTALYLYTSGTTGMPKATPISHYRLMQWSHWFAGMIGTTPNDKMYNCLPMYHSVGGVVAIGATLVGGGRVVLREKFSAKEFWADIAEWDCTTFQYIGEICRYLLKAPTHPSEANHRIRLVCGNGLAGGIWERFQHRFRIPRILEFYAATEGTVSLYNCEGRIGAIGRFPPFLTHRASIEILKCDLETGVPFRGEDGFCARCDWDEPGHAVGRITDDRQFLGYTDPVETQRKILRDVFALGDAWYSTGDLMKKDKGGYFYFVDRLGDTFRWKGENVATSEVAHAIEECSGISQATVYGVAVPHTDGRAGMAAIVVDSTFNLSAFRDELSERLPAYALPLFLRVCTSLDQTGTFKPQKRRLIQDGYNPNIVRDDIYFNYGKSFVPLDVTLYDEIENGEIRL